MVHHILSPGINKQNDNLTFTISIFHNYSYMHACEKSVNGNKTKGVSCFMLKEKTRPVSD